MSKRFLYLTLWAFLIVMMFSPVSAQELQVIIHIPSDENFPNPERGFYYQDAPMWLETELEPQYAEDLRLLRDDNISMVRFYFLIDEFRDAPISDEALIYIQEQFDVVREAGLKMIPRFAYNFPESGEYPYQDPDAPLARVLEHITQLTPILQNNADVIAFMEIGFVGAWGEWHSSTNLLVDEETGITDGSKAIITSLLQALPTNRMIAMRYLPYKQQLYGDQPLTPEQAFSGTSQARMGAHNDCFLASDTDFGTYSEDEAERQAQKDYLHADNLYVPQGGETCSIGEEAQPYIHCEDALRELAFLRYSTLNEGYHEDVLALWQAEGCYDDIAMQLGYRLRLIETQMSAQIGASEQLNMTIKLQNDGFGGIYNPRGFEIILRLSGGTEYRFPMENSHDPRHWLPDLGEIELSITIDLPADMPEGEYAVFINLPDPSPSLYGIPEYSIRLANAGIWEAETGFNYLGVQPIRAN